MEEREQLSEQTNKQPTPKPRQTWVAVVLALLCPGLGHVYVGKAGLGIAFLLGPWIFGLLALGAAVWANTAVLAAVVVFALVVAAMYVSQVVWAAVIARRASTDYRLRRYNHALAYVAYFIGATLLGGSGVIQATVIEAFKIPAASMIPSLLVGDQVFVCKIGERNRSPRRGDIIAFRSPDQPEEKYVKRLVGMPGDDLAISDGIITVNGKSVERRGLGTRRFLDVTPTGQWQDLELETFEERVDGTAYLVAEDPSAAHDTSRFDQLKIPENHYFVIGDNRDNSLDSRSWGPVPVDNYIGRVHSIWFSWGPDGLRSDRIGLYL